MRESTVPCYECSDRKAGCHDRCERYLAWKKEHARLKEKIAEEQAANRRINDFKIEQIRKTRRRK